MRIGIVSPILTRVPGAHSEWESTAGIEELGRIAEVADALGFHHLTCSEHVGVPVEVAEQRGGTYWDPLPTFGYLAARTQHIRLVTQVLVAGYHHPLAIAKRYGTLDRISGGRLTLGIGVGSLREEFELLEAPFEDRGPRADDAIAAVRAALSTPKPEYHGPYYDFSDFLVEPHALQPRVPIWIGGRTRRSLRRAVSHGDGWVPFGLKPETMAEMLADVAPPAGFEIVLPSGRPLDPLGAPESTARTLQQLRDAGATVVGAGITADSPQHYHEQLETLAELAQRLGMNGSEAVR